MSRSRRARFVALASLLASRRPDVDPASITAGRVLVDGRVLTNPAARVRLDASLWVIPEPRLRGNLKLAGALEAFSVPVAGRVAADIGASAGGFTTALLARGAARVYAIDAGVGQLVGRLRQHERVVNLEGRNLARLDRTVVPDEIEVLTVDLSYLAVADAVPQLEALWIHPAADLVALVKPTFELRRATLAASPDDVAQAVAVASKAIDGTHWRVLGRCDAPRTGRRGAREAFIHARRR